MKKQFYLALFFFMAVLSTHAQIKQGSVLLGGNLGFNTEKGSAPPNTMYQSGTTSFQLSPTIAKAIKDNLLLGFDLNYAHSSSNEQNNPGTSEEKSDIYGLGVFLREYKSLGNRFYIFTQEELSGNYSTASLNAVTVNKGTAVTLGFEPGLAYGISKRVQLETGFPNLFYLNYQHNNSVADNVKTHSFGLGTNMSSSLEDFEVGFRFLLGQ
jgi:hypothetical protein